MPKARSSNKLVDDGLGAMRDKNLRGTSDAVFSLLFKRATFTKLNIYSTIFCWGSDRPLLFDKQTEIFSFTELSITDCQVETCMKACYAEVYICGRYFTLI